MHQAQGTAIESMVSSIFIKSVSLLTDVASVVVRVNSVWLSELEGVLVVRM